jgi:hypothetical protein
MGPMRTSAGDAATHTATTCSSRRRRRRRIMRGRETGTMCSALVSFGHFERNRSARASLSQRCRAHRRSDISKSRQHREAVRGTMPARHRLAVFRV